jgi:heptosyltransferase III
MSVGAALGLSVGCCVGRERTSYLRFRVETIIIFRIGSLGDTVVALPCFHQVARKFPSSQRILVTDMPASTKAASVESVLGKGDLIDRVIYFPPPPRKTRDFMELRAQILEMKAYTLIYIADRNIFSTLRDLYFFRSCGIRHVIGAPIRRDLRRPRVDPETGETEHEAVRLARCLAPLGPIDLNDRAFWDLGLQPCETAAADNSLAPLRGKRFVAINTGGKVQSKDWGNDNWMALLRLMSVQHSSLSLVFIGSIDEFDRAAELAASWPGQTLDLCGCLTPRESAATMKQAMIFIGHDSGPMHLAAAAGIPCVALFGNFNRPKWWHPMGQGHRIIHNMRGVREITPGEVYAAVCSAVAEKLERVSYPVLDIVPESRLLHVR